MARRYSLEFVALAAVALAALLSLAAAPPVNERRGGNTTPAGQQRLSIEAASVRFAGDDAASLLIEGDNFGDRGGVLKLGDLDLTPHVTLWSETMIEADLLSHHIPPATYVVTVYTGIGLIFQDMIDVTIGAAGPQGPPGPPGLPGPPGPIVIAGKSCPSNHYLVGFDESARLICNPLPEPPAIGNSVTASANPATITLQPLPQCLILLQQIKCGIATITATVRDEHGAALSGQDVRFSTSSGVLFTGGFYNPIPASNVPIYTDSIGNATVDLISDTESTITVIAGNATTNVIVMAKLGELIRIVLDVDNSPDSLCAGSSSTNVTNCAQSICFKAQVLDQAGAPIDGVIMIFLLQNNTVQGNSFNATFSPSQAITGAGGVPGIARTRLIPNADCIPQCAVGSAGGPCMAEVVAATPGGVQSLPLQLLINIP